MMTDTRHSRRTFLGALVAGLALTGIPGARAASEATVRAIQEVLLSMGYAPGFADGVAGRNTERAIEAFQAEFGYAVTGEANDTLLTQLNSALAAGGASPERLLRREGLLRSYNRAVQEGLTALGYDPGPIDGAVGPMTREAILAFQTASGLSPTGEVSKPLLAAINTARGL